MSVDAITSLEQQLLIAMPSLTDELFNQSVVYVYEHDDKGAMAFIVNKPLPISVADILRQLNMELTSQDANNLFLLQGGPVSKEQLYIVQQQEKAEEGYSLVQPQELLDAFASGEMLDSALPFLGYAGWGAGQLEKEIMNNDWLLCPPDREILFDTPAEERWEACLKRIGVNPDQLIDRIGHA